MAKLNILLATYGSQNQPYLNQCLKSIASSNYKDKTLILVSSGEHEASYEALGLSCDVKHIHSHQRMHFPEAIHTAYQRVTPDCEYILLLNDDVILNKDCLARMVNTIEVFGHINEWILNPASNCDNFRRYYFDFILLDPTTQKTHPFNQQQYRIESMPDANMQLIRNGDFNYQPGLILCAWNAFYCTLMKKSTYDKVGGIDPVFKTGKDDLDFCYRAQKHNIQSAVVTQAFAFHFSGATADVHLTQEDREFNEKYFAGKLNA